MISESNVLLQEVLELPIFKTSRMLSEPNDVSLSVTSVNVMLDQHILEWLESGQIILTTG